jgi:putative serine protease PepD
MTHYATPSPTPAPAPAPRRTGRLVALVAAAAVVSGTAGGAVGASLVDEPAAALPETSSAVRTSAPAGDGVLAGTAARVLPSVVSVEVRGRSGSGSGSGVVLDEAGHVLTNDHVVATAVDGGISVVFDDGQRADVELVGRDPVTDLAVLRVLDDVELQPIALGRSADVRVGDPVMAVGSPLGLSGTVTTGIISAKDRTVRTTPETPLLGALQTDAAINPGNSGGALVDAQGRLVGINTAISSTSGGSIGLGFAIPVDQARSIAEELIRTGRATHPSLGVAATTVSDDDASGALLQQVPQGSAAGQAGLRSGDLVTSVDDEQVGSVDELVLALRERGVGDEVSIGYLRDGRAASTRVVLADRRA